MAKSTQLTLLLISLSLLSAAANAAPRFSPWGDAEREADTENSVQGGCPIESKDGLSLYMASGRDGGLGMNDIWVADRFDTDEAFGEAYNLGEPVNSEYADFCPTPLNGFYLMFVSTRPGPDACGGGDIHIVRRNPAKGWGDPVRLGCAEDGEGPNTAYAEFSPSLVEIDGQVYLYYSSDGVDGSDQDIYVSELQPDGSFSVGVPVVELNTPDDDRMPNISKNGLEIVFSSNRATWGGGQPAQGGQDVYTSSRSSTNAPWSEPENLGPGINTVLSETRASMSWDRERLHFGRDGEIYLSTRFKQRGKP
ncbi:MAG TPA: hypothetical protein VJ984_00420 [Xanthomonadales bacterium]|nr:hypothetical protein [Xanthomonadales bacterium]